VDNLPRMEGKKAFIFSRAGMNILWHNHIVREFSCRGRTQTGWLTKIGGINKGRSKKDLERARRFAERLGK